MKKTLTFLFALAGIASANSVVVEPAGLTLKMTEDSIAWVDASTSTVVKSLTSSSATTADGYFTTNGTNQIGDRFGWGNTSTNGMEMITFTLTFTADWTANASGASMLMAWGEGDDWGFGFGVGADGNWTVIQGEYDKPITITTSGVAAVDGGAQEYTIIGRMEALAYSTDGHHYTSPKGVYHIEAYEGETLVFRGAYGDANNMIQFGQGYNPYVGFGAGLNGSDATVMTVSGATLYIPEPATATLSLLALCGLAARRRRK
ncbi:MAG: PEP-CTERM sorting domain-containing protein [Akkermansia sp.]|nr:PEP-CTERM sorting domain-containing protein [Akkermansia sp.]